MAAQASGIKRFDRDYDKTSVLVGIMVLCLVGNGGFLIAPILLGGMVDEFGFSESGAGFVITAEMLGFAIASAICAAKIHQWDRRLLSICGLSVAILGNLASIAADSAVAISATRLVAGAGAGICIAVFNGTVAGTSDPDRKFAKVIAVLLLYISVAVYVNAILVERFGLAAVFVALSVTCAAGLFFVHLIPRYAPEMNASRASSTSQQPRRVSLTSRPVVFYCAAILAGYFLLYAGHMAVWSYEERMGIALGLTREQVGLVLGLAMIPGIVGALIANWIGTRYGRASTQLISLSISILAALVLVHGDRVFMYVLAANLITFSWYYGLPYLTGIMAWLDPAGRISAMGGTMFTIGAVVGPAIAASIVERGGYIAIGWIGASFYFICLALVWPVARRADASASR